MARELRAFREADQIERAGAKLRQIFGLPSLEAQREAEQMRALLLGVAARVELESLDIEGLERRWAEASELRFRTELEGRPKLPKNIGTHSRPTIERAVELFLTPSMSSTAADMKLNPRNATRLRLLVGARLLGWNQNGQPGLFVHPNVAARGDRIVLRYWHESENRWADPLFDRPPIRA